MHDFVASVLLPLAASPSPSPAPKGPNPDLVSPGVLGFLSFVFLIVTVFFVGRGLNKQLKRVNFPEAGDELESEPTTEPEPTTESDPTTATPEPESQPSE